MKKKIIVFVSVLMLPFTLGAQTYNSALLKNASISPYIHQLLVRNWDSGHVVSAYTDGTCTRFACSDHSGFFGPYSAGGFSSNAYYSDTLPRNYSVADMKVLDDVLYFCGTYHDSVYACGYIGYFDLNSLNTGVPFVFEIRHIDNVTLLNKLVPFYESGNKKVMAIGRSFNGSWADVIVEVNDITSATTCNFFHNTTIPELFYDIVYTGKEVVFVGKITIYDFLNIRIMDDLSSFSSSVGRSNPYYFNTGTFECNGGVIATHITGSTFATAYVHVDVSYYTKVLTLDISSGTPVVLHAQQYKLENKPDPIEMTFLPMKKMLAILQPLFTLYSTNYDPRLIFIDPYMTTAYTTDYTAFISTQPFQSIDCYRDDNIVTVGKETYLQKYPVVSSTGCPYVHGHHVEESPYPPFSTFNNTLPYLTSTITRFLYPSSSHMGSWGFSCGTMNVNK